MIKNKKIIGLLTGTLVIGSMMVGCGSEDTTTNQGQVSVETTQEETQDVVEEIAGQEVYNENDIRISYTGIEYDDIYGVTVKLKIENGSDKHIIVQPDNSSINGIMVDAIMSQDVLAGKVANGKLAIFNSYLEDNNITKVENVETTLLILDEEYNTLNEVQVSLDVDLNV